MRYLIKSQRDGWYFKKFSEISNLPCFGKIHEAKIYSDKHGALKDLKKMDQCGQRIIAVTRVGRSKYETSDNQRELKV